MTSLNQSLVDMYVSECNALKQKPNSFVKKYLHDVEQVHQSCALISELDLSKTLLGRKGVLPLLSVIGACVKLRLLNLNGTGLNDFAVGVLVEALMRHPSICIVYMRNNFITADSLPALKKLAHTFLDRAEKSSSLAAAVKRRNDETEFEIHIDTNPGIFESVVAELAVIRRTSNKLELEVAQAAPVPATALQPVAAVSKPSTIVTDDDVLAGDRKHSAAFVKDLIRVRRRLDQESQYNVKLTRRIKSNCDQWITLGVYFSSTFAEFPDEAHLIHRKLIPLVNHRLKEHRVHLVPIMFHTMEDEDFRITNTPIADGPMPINGARLPLFRRGAQHHLRDASGDDGNTLWCASSAEVAEVRELAVRDGCDIFVALHSDMFNPSCHAVDWNALETSPNAGGIPVLLYQRKVHNVPLGLQHMFDYKAQVQMQLASTCHDMEHGNGPKPKLADQISERKILVNDFANFQRRVQERVPKCMQHMYHATYAHVDDNGLPRFNVDGSFLESMSQDLFTAALAYRQKRLSGQEPRSSVFPLTLDCPTIPKQNWRSGGIKANPFAHLEHKLGIDDPERNKDPFFVKDMSSSVLSTKSPMNAVSSSPTETDDTPGATTFHCIYGQRGAGRTTQLKAVGARVMELKNKTSQLIVTHSVLAGKRTLQGVMTGILQQLVPSNVPVFGSEWPSFDDDDLLCQAFCNSLRSRCTLIPRFASCLWILIDDDDAVEFGSSFAEAFQSTQRRSLLKSSLPYEGLQIRVVFTSNIRPSPHEELTVHTVPNFDEIEAADLFVFMMLGIDNVPETVLQQVKHAAQYIVLQKKHGLKPLYLYLCAREMLYYNEEVSMTNIAEVLPGTVEELLTSCIRGTLPKDMTSVCDAISLAPVPMDGAMVRHCIYPCRRDPAFSLVAANRTWFSKRRWGGFFLPALSSSPLLFLFLANCVHLFQGSSRSKNRGFLTQRRMNFSDSVWRRDLVFLSRTIAETLSFRPKERRGASQAVKQAEKVIPSNPWMTTLLRTSLQRDQVHTLKSLANYFDPQSFFTTPHRVFTLLCNRRFDDLKLLFERLLLLLSAENATATSNDSAAKYGIDGPQRLLPQQVRSRLNELRISLQFVANDPEALLRQKKQSPLAVLMEYASYLLDHWHILVRHVAFMYACPHYAPPLIRESLEAALNKQNPCSYVRLDTAFSFAKKCYETALLLTSHAQEQLTSAQKAQQSPHRAHSSMSAEEPSTPLDPVHGPRIRSVLKASVVSKSFVISYRTITNAKPHEITPTMASSATTLSQGDENGGPSFGYVGVILVMPENPTKTSADYGFNTPSRNFAQQTLSKGTYYLSIKAHANAISALDIIETRHAVRFASAAYFDPEIVITALVLVPGAAESSKLQLVGRLTLENVQRPMIPSIALAPITKSQVSENGVDDGQRCPMVCVAVKNMLHVFEGQRFGHDNLYNRKTSAQAQVYSGHDNRIVHYGFSPAGAKIFSIDVSGHCFIWGSPESPCSGTILAVTDFGSVPSFARFVDHETLLVITNRGVTLWNSGNSQVQQLLSNPTRQPLEGNYAMLHYQPPSYIYGTLEDTELMQLPPHVKVHRLLEQLREKKHPTVTYMAFDGITVIDTAEKQIKVFRRQHVPPQNELECDKPPLILFAKDATHACKILPQVSTCDFVGNHDVEQWSWFLGAKTAAAIDTKEHMVKIFDLLKGKQVPLFFAVKEDTAQDQSAGPNDNTPLFAPLDDVAIAGENEDRVVVAQSNGFIHVTTVTKGPLLYPTSPLTTL